MREAITNQVRDDDSWNKGSLFAHLGKHEIFTPIILGIPIHLAFGIRTSSIALFVAIQCTLQVAMSPWLFAARATQGSPRGQVVRRTKVVIVWLTLGTEAAVLQMFGGDFKDKVAVTLFLGGPFVLGSICLIATHWLLRRSGWNQAS